MIFKLLNIKYFKTYLLHFTNRNPQIYFQQNNYLNQEYSHHEILIPEEMFSNHSFDLFYFRYICEIEFADQIEFIEESNFHLKLYLFLLKSS
jgi:hypothetical protein